MKQHDELSIILKTTPFKDRDKIVVFFTENEGRVSAVAKGAINSKRFAGALDFLACSNIHYIKKETSNLVRIESAQVKHEFTKLHLDYDRLTAASFAAEFILRLVEENTPHRDLFVVLSNFLFEIDKGGDALKLVNAFLIKVLTALGYSPNILKCVNCEKPSHLIVDCGLEMYWSTTSGGMICGNCKTHDKNTLIPLEPELMILFERILTVPFKEQAALRGNHEKLFRLLHDFLYHHVPGLPRDGLKTLSLLKF